MFFHLKRIPSFIETLSPILVMLVLFGWGGAIWILSFVIFQTEWEPIFEEHLKLSKAAVSAIIQSLQSCSLTFYRCLDMFLMEESS